MPSGGPSRNSGCSCWQITGNLLKGGDAGRRPSVSLAGHEQLIPLRSCRTHGDAAVTPFVMAGASGGAPDAPCMGAPDGRWGPDRTRPGVFPEAFGVTQQKRTRHREFTAGDMGKVQEPDTDPGVLWRGLSPCGPVLGSHSQGQCVPWGPAPRSLAPGTGGRKPPAWWRACDPLGDSQRVAPSRVSCSPGGGQPLACHGHAERASAPGPRHSRCRPPGGSWSRRSSPELPARPRCPARVSPRLRTQRVADGTAFPRVEATCSLGVQPTREVAHRALRGSLGARGAEPSDGVWALAPTPRGRPRSATGRRVWCRAPGP